MRLALSLAAAHWVVDRVLYHAADMRTDTEPARSSGLTRDHVLMLLVANLSDCRHTLEKNEAKLAGRHTHKGVLALFGHKLCRRAGGTDHYRAAAGLKLYIMDYRSNGDVSELQSIAGADVRAFAGDDRIAHVESDRGYDVSLLAIPVGDKGDARGAVGIVFDRGNLARDSGLVALEVDNAVFDSSASAAMSRRDAPVVVASR